LAVGSIFFIPFSATVLTISYPDYLAWFLHGRQPYALAPLP